MRSRSKSAGTKTALMASPERIARAADARLPVRSTMLSPGEAATKEAIELAGFGGFKVISVDYRMPPEFPYPAAMDDAMAIVDGCIHLAVWELQRGRIVRTILLPRPPPGRVELQFTRSWTCHLVHLSMTPAAVRRPTHRAGHILHRIVAPRNACGKYRLDA